MVGVRTIFIFQDFFAKSSPIRIQCSACSNRHQKVMVVPGDPFPDILDTPLVQCDAHQGLLYSPKQEKVSQRQIQRKRQMLQHLDPLCRYPLLLTGSSMVWFIVAAEPPLLLSHDGPLLKMLQELAQGLDSVGDVDGGTLRDYVGMDEAPQVKKCDDWH
jgi:hypothetical protein